MANETNAVNDFIDALKAENGNDKLLENLLPQPKQEEQPQPEGEQEEKPEKSDFHKDPKVKRYIEKEVKKALSQMPQPTQEYVEKNPDRVQKLKEKFIQVVGNDKPENAALVEEFTSAMEDFKNEISEAKRFGEAQQQEAQQQQQIEEELHKGFEDIEEQFGVDLWDESNRKLKGQFLDYVKDIAHKDKDGEMDEFPDLVGAYPSFSKMSKKENPTLMAKDLADRSGTKSSSGAGDSRPTERITFDNIGDKIDRMFG